MKDLQKLSPCEQRLNLIMRATQDAFWDWDLKTNELWWSSSFYSLFGYSKDDVGSTIDSWTKLIHPDDVLITKAEIDLVIKNKRDRWEHEYRFKRADNSYALVFDRGFAL